MVESCIIRLDTIKKRTEQTVENYIEIIENLKTKLKTKDNKNTERRGNIKIEISIEHLVNSTVQVNSGRPIMLWLTWTELYLSGVVSFLILYS